MMGMGTEKYDMDFSSSGLFVMHLAMYNPLVLLPTTPQPRNLLVQCPTTIPTRVPRPLISPLTSQRRLRDRIIRFDLWSTRWPVHTGYVVLLSAEIAFLSVFFEELDVAI